jgi:hypothetical protein
MAKKKTGYPYSLNFLQPGMVGGYGSAGTLPALETGLASTVNQFMTGQAALPYQTNLPGYQANIAQRGTNIGGLLRGEVPMDVQRQMIQGAGERGVSTGMAGSPNTNAAWLRALGLTSLGLQQAGSQQLGEAIAQTPVPEIWNPMALYVPERAARLEESIAQGGEYTPPATSKRSWSYGGGPWRSSPRLFW